MTGNIGEWSELYTLLKLLSSGKLYAADENSKRIDDIYYQILEVIRQQTNGTWYYEKNTQINIIKDSDRAHAVIIDVDEFELMAKKLLTYLKESKVKRGSFELPDIWAFAAKIKCNTIKARSTSKTDITLKVHDSQINYNHIWGFSIKSQLGQPSTLLNASEATNFVYELIGHKLSDSEIKRFRGI